MKASGLEPGNQFTGLFLGRSGSGKTGAACSFPKPFVFDFDRRINGLLGLSSWLSRDAIDYEPCDARNGLDVMSKKVDIWRVQKSQRSMPYQTIIVDSIYTFALALMYESKSLRGGGSGKGIRRIGSFDMITPEDYNYASQAMHQVIYDWLLPLGVNIIFSGWVVDRWGRPENDKNEYAEREVIGEKILTTDKLAEAIPGYFNEIYKFDKTITGISSSPLKYTVEFRGDMARTTYDKLPNGRADLTGKNFYEYWSKAIEIPIVEVKPIDEKAQADRLAALRMVKP